MRQRAKVQLLPDPELDRVVREAIVEITLADGTQLTERTKAVRGSPNNPMPREEVVAKCADLMTPVLGAAKSTEVIERVLGIEHAVDMRALRPLLQQAG